MTLFFGINEFAATALVACDKPGLFTSTLVLMMVLNVGLNMALIAPVGVTGAALAGTRLRVALARLGQAFVRWTVGWVRLVRSFGTPVLARGAMALAIVASAQELVLGPVAGSLACGLTLLAAERLLFPVDFARFRELLRQRAVE
jgi:O-antigen/teichoic acid export membrane protein